MIYQIFVKNNIVRIKPVIKLGDTDNIHNDNDKLGNDYNRWPMYYMYDKHH